MAPLYRRRRFFYFLLLLALAFFVLTASRLYTSTLSQSGAAKNMQQNSMLIDESFKHVAAQDVVESFDPNKAIVDDVQSKQSKPLPNYNVHIFYYPWYGNPQFDGSYYHWNHEYLPHWEKKQSDTWPTGAHKPPDDVGANFYPHLGCYSSRDPSVIDQHMKWIRAADVGVVVVSWYPPGRADGQGRSWDDLVPKLLDAAHQNQLKLTIHIEPYANRTAESVQEDVAYILRTYGSHPAFYYHQPSRSKDQKKLPLFYVYDSYLTPTEEWKKVLRSNGPSTVRGTSLDAYFLGLLVKNDDRNSLLSSGFDGFYTYFAANDFTYGSTWLNWKALTGYGRKSKMISSISVGPGYVDDRIRPWNKINIRPRENGEYYRNSWTNALNSAPNIISITSFNEWHEGTQIEPSIPKKVDNFKYLDFTPYDPEYYISLTRENVAKFNAPKDVK